MADTQSPLLGVILCCTSIPPEQRSELAAFATQMGAVHKLDLTSDVTHLVVGDSDTPKYKFVAKERPDVKCLLASWVEAVRASWLEGGETDIEDLERVHRLPTFSGLKLCVTGFDDLIYRKELEDSINDNGADYQGNLTKDVTHLVAKEPSGAKYDYARQWGIRIVTVEWVEQSLERGMILDETLYQLSIPPEERGRNAWMRRSESATSLGKRTRGEDVAPQNARKLRRTASARLSSQNVGLWSELVGAPIKVEETKADAWDEQPKRPVNDHMDPPISHSEDVKITPTAQDQQRTLKKSLSEANLGSFLGRPFESILIFQGKSVLLWGFDEKKTAIIQDHLRSHGAEVIENAPQLPSLSNSGALRNTFLVIPHTTSASDTPLQPEPTKHLTVVTELWVERCIYQKKLEDPRDHATSTPFSQFPIAGFEDLSICSTGFQGVDLLHMSKCVNLMGGTYSEYFTPKSSVLVCNSAVPGHEKLRHARIWSIPAVKASWLWDSIRKGELMPFSPYLVQPLTDPDKFPEIQKESGKTDPIPQTKDSNIEQKAARRSLIKQPCSRAQHSSKAAQLQMHHSESTSKSRPKPSPSPKRSPSSKTEHQAPPIYLDDDDPPILPDSIPDAESPTTLAAPSNPAPLQEITPNSSPPKPSTSPTKPLSPSKTRDPPSPQQPSASETSSSLGPTISSLLAHHQRTTSNSNPNPPPSNSSSQRPYRPRRRHLLGRAPSNLSSHSTSHHLSRASSVDTMNTDGLGTPLEASGSTNNNNNNSNTTTDNQSTSQLEMNVYSLSNINDDPDRVDEAPPMTQLGYEDPNVAAWRERVAVKMGGGKVKGGTPGRKGVGKANGEGLGIAKRTRLAASGR